MWDRYRETDIQLSAGQKVFWGCRRGRHRSAAAAAMYILRIRKASSAKAAMDLVTEAAGHYRPQRALPEFGDEPWWGMPAMAPVVRHFADLTLPLWQQVAE